MREQGISLKGIGLSSLLLPWALKFLWAPLVDRTRGGFLGPRRSWIIPLHILSMVVLGCIAFADPTVSLSWVLLGVLAINACASTHDIATDGLAVEMLKPEERGLANGIQVGAYRLGMILGGGVLLFLATLGWRNAFFVMCACMGVALMPIALYSKHRLRSPSPSTRLALAGYFKHNHAWTWVLVIILFKGLDSLVGPMVEPMMVDAGYSLSTIGYIRGRRIRSGSGRRSHRRHRCPISGPNPFAHLVWRLASVCCGPPDLTALNIGGLTALYIATILDSLLSMATAALFTAMMDRCRPDQAGTDYTIQASIVVCTQIGMASLAVVAEAMGCAATLQPRWA